MFYIPFRLIGILALLLAAWYGIWYFSMSADVKRIELTLKHHEQRIEELPSDINLQFENVHAVGFPLNSAVAIGSLTLELRTFHGEYMSARLDNVKLEKVNAGEGRYRVVLPETLLANYTQNGKEERYRVYANEMPVVMLRAQADSRTCMSMPGTPRCAEVGSDNPLITYAIQLPKYLLLTAQEASHGEEKIEFNFPVSTPMPFFTNIPAEAERPLSLFIGMLREALIFRNQ